MDSFFKLIAAGPAFFVSAWLPIVLAGLAPFARAEALPG